MKEIKLFDGRQLTAARALAGLSIVELAKAAGITPRTLHRLEIGGVVKVSALRRRGFVTNDIVGRIMAGLKSHGVELTHERGHQGSGVRWEKPRRERSSSHSNECRRRMGGSE